jgi:hypothetical protein
MLTSNLRFIVQCSGSIDIRTEIQSHILMLYDVKQATGCKVRDPGRAANAMRPAAKGCVGPLQTLAVQSWAIRALFLACESQTLEYERWLCLDLPGCYASHIGTDIKKFLAARPAGPTGKQARRSQSLGAGLFSMRSTG